MITRRAECTYKEDSILLAGRQETSGEKKPDSQHLHKTRESCLPLIIYDILRNGETPGRRQEKNVLYRMRATVAPRTH